EVVRPPRRACPSFGQCLPAPRSPPRLPPLPMPLLVRKKLVSADWACAGALARADMAASAKHTVEMILVKRFIWCLPVVFRFVGINTSRGPLFHREVSGHSGKE